MKNIFCKHKIRHLIVLGLGYIIALSSCLPPPSPNENTFSQEVIDSNIVAIPLPIDYDYTDSVYVPIYSDIYSRTKDIRFLLTATLSVRNTSFVDTMIIRAIDYFDTKGKFIRDYLDHPIYLAPMASIDYVIDEEDRSGGSGANFIVIWSAKNVLLKPVIQAVMISTNGQQGVAFTTEGQSIKQSNN